MNPFARLVAAIVLALPVPLLAQEHSVSLADKAMLQAAMQRHIDGVLVEGRYLHLDEVSGDVLALTPQGAHPQILRMGEHFILCADFRGPDGDKVNVDYYVARRGSSFVVFGEHVENRALVKRPIASGRAALVD